MLPGFKGNDGTVKHLSFRTSEGDGDWDKSRTAEFDLIRGGDDPLVEVKITVEAPRMGGEWKKYKVTLTGEEQVEAGGWPGA